MKQKKRVLVIGFEEHSERMYPHTYDFLQELKKHCELLSYCGCDDRGISAYNLWHDLAETPSDPKWIFRIFRSIKRFIEQHYYIRSNIKKSLEEYYDVVIAIDHTALNLVCRYNKHNSKLLFWTHDIITQDHIHYQSPFIRRILKLNKKNITKYAAIIVQDRCRGAVLDSVIGSHDMDRFYLPACLKDDDFAGKVSREKRLQERPLERINIMQSTVIETRGSDLLLKAYQHLDNRIMLHFQGNIARRMLDMIHVCKRSPQIIPFQDTLSKMREQISLMDLGYVAYNVSPFKDLNSYFISKATGQTVEFIRLGIPVITFGDNDLKEFVEMYKIGVNILNLEQLEGAIFEVVDHYSEYSNNARNVFKDVFDLKLYSEKVCGEILDDRGGVSSDLLER